MGHPTEPPNKCAYPSPSSGTLSRGLCSPRRPGTKFLAGLCRWKRKPWFAGPLGRKPGASGRGPPIGDPHRKLAELAAHPAKPAKPCAPGRKCRQSQRPRARNRNLPPRLAYGKARSRILNWRLGERQIRPQLRQEVWRRAFRRCIDLDHRNSAEPGDLPGTNVTRWFCQGFPVTEAPDVRPVGSSHPLQPRDWIASDNDQDIRLRHAFPEQALSPGRRIGDHVEQLHWPLVDQKGARLTAVPSHQSYCANHRPGPLPWDAQVNKAP
jgi:hypothetical protein